MTFAITAPYAALLAVIFIVLTQIVIRTRIVQKVGLGDGGNVAVLLAIRRQANFVENVPLALILLALAEAAGSNPLLLNACGILLLVARLIHPFGIVADNASHPLRIAGAASTNLVQLVLAVLLIVKHFS